MSSETRRVPNKRRFDPAELMVGTIPLMDRGDFRLEHSISLMFFFGNFSLLIDGCFGWLFCESLSPSGCKTSGWDLLKFEQSWLILTQAAHLQQSSLLFDVPGCFFRSYKQPC